MGYMLVPWLTLAVMACPMALLFFFEPSKLWKLYFCTGRNSSVLTIPISHLGVGDLMALIAFMGLKYIMNLLGLLPSPVEHDDGIHLLLPEISAVAKLQITEDEEDLFEAATSCYGESSGVPLHRILFLPALVNPMLALILANRKCPILPFGSVNIRNQFWFQGATNSCNPRLLDYQNATVTAYFGGSKQKGRRVKQGMEFDIRIIVTIKDPSGRDQSVFEEIATILNYLPTSAKPEFKDTPENIYEPKFSWSSGGTGMANLDTSAPRSWAAVCKDYNPIHISKMMAKIFGSPAVIAHGNHVLAIGLLQTQSSLCRPLAPVKELEDITSRYKDCVLRVMLKRPIILPTEIKFEYGSVDGGGFALRAMKDEKELLLAYMTQQ